MFVAKFFRMAPIIAGIILTAMTSVAGAFEAFQPLPDSAPGPADNPQSVEKVGLGKQLYFDPRLSVNVTLSCNSCHNLAAGGEDGRSQAVGVYGRKSRRSTPTIWNAAFHSTLNWYGNEPTLEQQVKDHLLAKEIMGMPNAAAVMARINSIYGYAEQFKKIFGGKESVTYDNIARALASFERTLITPNSAFDRYLAGDKEALSPAAERGFKRFKDIGCSSCHFYVNLAGPQPGLQLKTGEGFWELFPTFAGSAYDAQYGLLDDLGRYEVTGMDNHKRMWRMPTLRNVALTAPYFHNGSVPTLYDAVVVMAKTQLNKEIGDDDASDIVEFLDSLTGEFPDISLPRLPSLDNGTLYFDKH